MDEPVPEGLLSIDLGEAAVSLVVDATLYPIDAIYAAAYVFIDRAWVFLDRPASERVRVTLAAKRTDLDAETLRARLKEAIGEFANELLSCAWRHEITRANRAVIETVTMQAFSGAMGPPSLDELEQFDFTDEPFDDPLGIAVSWEEKYKKKPRAGEGEP